MFFLLNLALNLDAILIIFLLLIFLNTKPKILSAETDGRHVRQCSLRENVWKRTDFKQQISGIPEEMAEPMHRSQEQTYKSVSGLL